LCKLYVFIVDYLSHFQFVWSGTLPTSSGRARNEAKWCWYHLVSCAGNLSEAKRRSESSA